MSELDYSKLCSNYICNHNDGCCMESCEFYNHNECPVVYVNCLLGEKDKTISDLESKLAKKDTEITRRLRLQDDEFLEERKEMEQQIADLEAKLAESEEAQKKAYQEGFLQKLFDKDMEISQLKRRLVEKVKIISKLKEANDSFSFIDYYICKHLGKNNIYPKDVSDFVESFDQLKQKLTEKEETINNLEQQCLICNKDQENERLKQQLAEKDKEIAFLKGFKDAITSTIDNQIKQLKGVK